MCTLTGPAGFSFELNSKYSCSLSFSLRSAGTRSIACFPFRDEVASTRPLFVASVVAMSFTSKGRLDVNEKSPPPQRDLQQSSHAPAMSVQILRTAWRQGAPPSRHAPMSTSLVRSNGCGLVVLTHLSKSSLHFLRQLFFWAGLPWLHCAMHVSRFSLHVCAETEGTERSRVTAAARRVTQGIGFFMGTSVA